MNTWKERVTYRTKQKDHSNYWFKVKCVIRVFCKCSRMSPEQMTIYEQVFRFIKKGKKIKLKMSQCDSNTDQTARSYAKEQ